MKNFLWKLAFILIALSACASNQPVKDEPPVFFPGAPALPRIQFLTSFTSSKDIVRGRSAFDRFVTGEREQILRLNKPYGIAVYDGKIYVCDTNATVMVFDLKKNTFSRLQGAQGMGKLSQPINITIDEQGNKYISDPVRAQVVVFDKNDFYVRAYGPAGEWRPIDAVAYEGNLYVADSKNAEIKVFDLQTGEVIRKIGQQDEEKLGIPTNIAFDKEGFLYVSDTGRFQILKLDRDGHIQGAVGRLGKTPGSFARPRGIAFDRDNRLYAVDAAFDNVQIFKEGQLLLFFSKSGGGRGDLYLPAAVTIDYDHISYFRHYADPRFEIEALIFVTSQFGGRLVNVYGLGKEKDRNYPTETEITEQLLEKLKNKQEQPEAPGEKDKPTNTNP